MAQTIFLDEDYFKSLTIVDDNVGAKTFKATVLSAQDFYLEPLLGTKLYDKLKSDVQADSLTGNYLTLMTTYVVPALIRYVEADIVWQNHYRIRNKGTMVKSSENSQPASPDEIDMFSDKFMNRAQQKGRKLVEYLQCNTDKFPEYCEDTDGGDLDPVNTASKVGWVLGNANIFDGKKDKDYYENK